MRDHISPRQLQINSLNGTITRVMSTFKKQNWHTTPCAAIPKTTTTCKALSPFRQLQSDSVSGLINAVFSISAEILSRRLLLG